MNRLEQFKADHSEVKYVYKKLRPIYKGLCIRNIVFIDPSRNSTRSQELVTIAEEYGHFVTGVGNITEEKTIVEQKQEAKARLWGNHRLVSLDDLIACIEKGISTVHEIAEELEVTDECVENAIEGYRTKNGMRFKHKGYWIIFNTDTSIRVIKAECVRKSEKVGLSYGG